MKRFAAPVGLALLVLSILFLNLVGPLILTSDVEAGGSIDEPRWLYHATTLSWIFSCFYTIGMLFSKFMASFHKAWKK